MHSQRWNYLMEILTGSSAFFFSLRLNAAYGLLIHGISRTHTKTHQSRKYSSGLVISSSQRSLPDNTQHSQQINIHAPVSLETQNLSRRAAEGLRLRPRGYWDRHFVRYIVQMGDGEHMEE